MTDPRPHDWLIRMLGDLAAYARVNNLPRLAAHLDEARALAALETVDAAGGQPPPDG